MVISFCLDPNGRRISNQAERSFFWQSLVCEYNPIFTKAQQLQADFEFNFEFGASTATGLFSSAYAYLSVQPFLPLQNTRLSVMSVFLRGALPCRKTHTASLMTPLFPSPAPRSLAKWGVDNG